MRCARCGNDNPAINRFCGMCGANLLSASGGDAPSASPTATSTPVPVAKAPVPVEPPRPAPAVSAPAAHDEGTAISGPSFLGLNQPAAQHRDGNLAYLLEDDHPAKSSGAWKIVLILIALGMALGFGYLRWRHEGLAWLTAGMRKPDGTSQTAPDGPSPDSSSAAQQPSAADSSTPPASVPASTSASQPPAGQPAPSTDPAAAGTNSAAANPAATTPAASPTTDAVVPPAAPASSTTNPPTTVKEAAPASNPSTEAVDKSPAPEPAPKPRPAPKPAPVKPIDPVTEAERYIYGRGVTQDCDRGLKILRPSAAQSNTQAMISLGGLYSTGQCTPRDLPTAYRWFALALRRQPDNQSLNEDLKKLWVQMTQPERQLAIKLTH